MTDFREEERIRQEEYAARERQLMNFRIRNGLIIGFLVIGFLVLMSFAMPAYFRYQNLQNARNQVRVNAIVIDSTNQLIEVEKKKAEIKYQEAIGIKRAQEEIAKTLTDQYLQHEAIEAQLKMAGSPNHTQIYIPVGQNGLPVVKTIP